MVKQTKIAKVDAEQTDTASQNSALKGRTVEECLGCGDKKAIVSRGLCDNCRKRTARESLDQAAKRRVVNERAESHRLLKIYQHFQSGYLQLGLSPEKIAAELLGLLNRCAPQFAPVLHLLNPAGVHNNPKSGSGHAPKPSTSTSTPVIAQDGADKGKEMTMQQPSRNDH